MACGHQRRGASPTPDQEEINGYSLLELPAAPQHFLKSDNFATWSDPAFNFIFSQPRPYSKMLTLQMGRPFPSKASSPSLASSRHFLQRPQVQGYLIIYKLNSTGFWSKIT
jgi:hypothetical protein